MLPFLTCILVILAAQGQTAQAADRSIRSGSRELASVENCYYGCYADQFDYRAVKRFLYKDYQNMTVEACQAKAVSRNYSIFAVQYARECWVSKGFKRALTYGPSSNCNMSCTGDANQICGGWLAFNLYTVGPCAPPSPPPPPPSPPPPTTSVMTMVFENSAVANCNATRDAFYENIIIHAGMKNGTVVRCSNSTPTTISVSTRFTFQQDIIAAVSLALDISNGGAAAVHDASAQGCKDTPGSMSMVVTDNSQGLGGSSRVYIFACNPTVPSNGTISFYNAPFMCCSPSH